MQVMVYGLSPPKKKGAGHVLRCAEPRPSCVKSSMLRWLGSGAGLSPPNRRSGCPTDAAPSSALSPPRLLQPLLTGKHRHDKLRQVETVAVQQMIYKKAIESNRQDLLLRIYGDQEGPIDMVAKEARYHKYCWDVLRLHRMRDRLVLYTRRCCER